MVNPALNVSRQILVWCAIIGGLYLSSLYSYILFHSIVEIFSIVVLACIFLITWNSRRFLDNNYMLFLGISFLFITIIDGLHMLSYKGMGVFQGYSSNIPTQLWIIMRYLLAISFLIAPVFMKRKVNVPLVLSAYSVATILLLLSVFYWGTFPACYEEGSGLTPFKIYSEYVISLILLSSLVYLHIERKTLERGVVGLLASSTILSILAEITFATYVSVYGFSNMLGHVLILVSFYLIYKALIETGLTKPYELMFRDLKLSEEKYRKLFENMSSAFSLHEIITDNSGRPVDYVFLAVNPLFEKMTGLQQKDIVGKRVTEVLPGTEKDPADWIGTYGKVALSGEPISFEQYSEVLDKWYSIVAYSPTARQFATVFADITEHKKTEDALKKSEVRYRELITNLDAGVVVHAPDTTIIMNNPRASELLGLSDDQMKGKLAIDPQWKFINESTAPLPIKEYPVNQIAGSQKTLKNQTVGVCRPLTNDITWLMVNGFPVLDSKGEISEIIISFIDITERKRAEAEIESARDQYQSLVNNIPGIVYRCKLDRDWTMLYMSDAVDPLSGYPSSDFIQNAVRTY